MTVEQTGPDEVADRAVNGVSVSGSLAAHLELELCLSEVAWMQLQHQGKHGKLHRIVIVRS